jgi:hypothetical protein
MMRASSAITVIVAWTLATAAPAAGATRPRVIVTIDVESNEQYTLPEQVDAVCEGTPCGVMEIARQLQARGWSGTFFLNVYEHKRFGAEKLKEIALRLQRAGQDVELHTHPQDAYDVARWGMHQYSLDEQTAIVRDGVRLLESWIGQPVVAHRAGAYSANENTLTALERSGILLDSSVFWQNENNHFGSIPFLRNRPTLRGRVLEIPITVYERDDVPGWLDGVTPPSTSVRKIDADWFVTEAEMHSAIDKMVSAQPPTLVLFLHSFSLMSEKPVAGKPMLDRHSVDMFQGMLDRVAAASLPVVPMRTLAVDDVVREAAGDDVVPRVTLPVSMPVYAWHWIKLVDRRALGVGVGLAGILIGYGAFTVVYRQRRGKHLVPVRSGADLR